ncbi:G-alpha-domain-containing protein [Schizopora paradoxa]|uniref:G-alpha-domain-containing protein n=1 Tax=Schizopora paradoxa TaxID=27342 RepID=A0A0H2RDE2_9AGAM|nr:G-alpha-domain-containing protein [Schizopora paradoxa]
MARTVTSPTTSFTSSFLGGGTTSHTSTALPNPATNPDDPFYAFLAPPPDETPEQRAAREKKEADARKVNDEIDEMLKAERAALKKKKAVKVLLLGQSESGKSTTLKNFQLTYARKAWQEERSAWRAVVQLNLCRSTNLILDILTEEMAFEGALSTPSPGGLIANTPVPPTTSAPSSTGLHTPEIEELEQHSGGSYASPSYTTPNSPRTPRSPHSGGTTSVTTPGSPPGAPLPKLLFDDKHRLLKLRLGPLRRVQRDLEVRLGAGAEEPIPALAGAAMTEAAPFGGSASALAGPSSSAGALPAAMSTLGSSSAITGNVQANGSVTPYFVPPSRRGPQEFYVRSSTGWKAALERLRPAGSGRSSTEREREDAKNRSEREAEETTRVIAECREDIGALWNDEVVKTMLARRRLRLEEGGGFFLNDIDRIAVPNYEPSDDDIVRARLRTMGVQEYRFMFEKGMESGQEWLMYDVGGTRSLRAAWPPFFDDMNAIIFLAPISCFDEKLAEDRRVNRLEDSFLLWKAVCANKLLRKTMLILFLNKCDLLERKLNAGVEFKHYVPSFGGERKNDVASVTKYLKQKFRDMSKQHSPQPRSFFVHLTSVIDTKATAITLTAVREGILRDHLRARMF